jgi:hypothetical protein
MLAGTVLDRVSSVNDLGVIMDEKMNLSKLVDVMVGKVFAILGHQKTVNRVQRSIHSEVSLHVFGCVWSIFYAVRVEKVVRVKRSFIRYALRSLGWDTYDLPPYEHRCALLRFDTLVKRRSITCIRFIFDILSGRINSPNLLSALNLNTRYRTRSSEFFRISFHRTS